MLGDGAGATLIGKAENRRYAQYIESIGQEGDILTNKENPIIKFKYDKTKDTFVFENISDVSMISDYSKNFVLNKGETKDFYIVIKNTAIGDNDYLGEIKLIYKLSY